MLEDQVNGGGTGVPQGAGKEYAVASGPLRGNQSETEGEGAGTRGRVQEEWREGGQNSVLVPAGKHKIRQRPVIGGQQVRNW